MDYHNAEPQLVSQGMSTYWIAKCKCRWEGAKRTTKQAAEADALAHDVTENPK